MTSAQGVVLFWVLYFLVPFFTGMLAYNWLPNESYSPKYDELIASHVADDGDRTGTIADAWRDRETGVVYRLSDFEQHHRAEARRLTYTWFMYGLIGCAFFAFSQAALKSKSLLRSFCLALLVNVGVAAFEYFESAAINARLFG